MIERRVVRRYAAALYNAASKAKAVDRIESDLGLVSYVIETSPALMDAITSPLVLKSKKHAILRDIFAGKVHDITMAYLDLLVDKRREEALAMTEEEYIRIANEARGIINVQVVTAVRLTEDEEARLKAKLASRTGKSVHLEKIVDPRIIGGMTVRIVDTVIDGSVRGYLIDLKDKLMS